MIVTGYKCASCSTELPSIDTDTLKFCPVCGSPIVVQTTSSYTDVQTFAGSSEDYYDIPAYNGVNTAKTNKRILILVSVLLTMFAPFPGVFVILTLFLSYKRRGDESIARALFPWLIACALLAVVGIFGFFSIFIRLFMMPSTA